MKFLIVSITIAILCSNSTILAQDYHEIDSIRTLAKILGNNGLFEESIELYNISIHSYNNAGQTQLSKLTAFDKGLIICSRDDISINDKDASLKSSYLTQQLSHIKILYKPLDLINGIIHNRVNESIQTETINDLEEKEEYCILHKLHTNLSVNHYYIGDLEKSIYHIKEAERFKELCSGVKKSEFLDFFTIKSAVLYEIGKVDQSLENSIESINLLEKSSVLDTVGLAYSYNNLASIYSELMDEYSAIEYYQKTVDLINKYSGFFPETEQASFLNNLALSKKSIDQYDGLIELEKRLIKILEHIKDKSLDNWEDMIISYTVITDAYLKSNQIDSAIYYNNKALLIADKAPSIKHSIFSGKYTILLKRKQFKEAEKALLKSLSISSNRHGLFSSATINLKATIANFYLQIDRVDESLQVIQQCLVDMSIGFSPHKAYDNPLLEQVQNKTKFCNLMSTKIKALTALYQQTPDPKLIDAIYDCTKLATEALVEVNRTFKNTNSKRFWLNQNAIPFYEQAIRTAYTLAQETGNQHYLYEAFQLCEQSKSMMMNDVLQEQQAAALGGVPQELIDQQAKLEQLVADAEKTRFDAHAGGDQAAEKAASDELFEYRDQLGRLRLRFELDFPDYYKLKYSNDTTTVQEVQAALAEGDGLLEYFEGNDHLYCFIITKTGFQVQQLEKSTIFNILLQRFQVSLMDIQLFSERPLVAYNNYVKDAFSLYKDLLSQVDLTKLQRLIIVPDGKLSYLPFEVLLSKPCQPVEKIRAANFKDLPYLLRQFPVNYLYSAQIWLQQRQPNQRSNNGQILGLAPTYEGIISPDWRPQREVALRDKLINLPGAAAEVANLKKHYRGAYYPGAAATESQFRAVASEYSILHLAMHGLIDRTNPEFSGLAMSEDQSQGQDNFLYAYEIKKLPLNADLVVLSACETGIGKYQRGEGVVSIGRGFIYAGAPALLMTLWSLNDDSGAFIMEEFYKNLHEGMPKDEAIRQAKLKYLTYVAPEYAHPFMWGAFVSMGDYRSIELQTPTPIWWYLDGAILGLLVLLGGIKIVRSKKEQ